MLLSEHSRGFGDKWQTTLMCTELILAFLEVKYLSFSLPISESVNLLCTLIHSLEKEKSACILFSLISQAGTIYCRRLMEILI